MTSVQKVTFRGLESNLINRGLPQVANPVWQSSAQTTVAQKEKMPAEVNNKGKSVAKGVAYVSGAVALASLGVATAVSLKNGKLNKALSSLSSRFSDETSRLSTLLDDVQKKSETLAARIETGLADSDKQIKDLGKWQDGQIAGACKDLNSRITKASEDLNGRISQISTTVSSPGAESIFVRPTNVNGLELNLAYVLNGYGIHTAEVERELRMESTKRIFGLIDRKGIKPKKDVMVRVPTSEFSGFTNAGGMSVVPREVIANLGAMINSKQKVRLVVDTPMYLGQVENDVYYSLVRKGENAYEYVSSANDKAIAKLEKIDQMQLPIYTDKGKTHEHVDLFMARDNEQVVDLGLLLPRMERKLADRVSKAIAKDAPFEINAGPLVVRYNPAKGINKPTASVKFDAVFYKHDKFRMDGPRVEGKDKAIYDNVTHEAGETERFMYFDKFFFENLVRNRETSTEHLRADLIMGNDWQTGGISAMMRLLPIVKKHFGMDPKVAEELYNTPIMTIMHNAGLAGNAWHSQSKLLNILFGEHADMIVRNAYMPKNAGLNGDSLNGLFHGNNVNPQTMASVYSDVITPVAEGYGGELVSHSGFGGANHDIYRMRARAHEFSDIEHVKYIAGQNGLDKKLVKDNSVAYRPITNGSDRVNNLLTEEKARKLEADLHLEPGSLWVLKPGDNIYEWHKHNKGVYLKKIVEEAEMARTGKGNPLNIELPEMTNLAGVNEDTMVISTAGRVSDQKGYDILAEGIEEFLSRHLNDKNLPFFYNQGKGDAMFIDMMLNVKRRIAHKYGQKVADRILFARVFSQDRYNGSKMIADYSAMTSWFEPCGLVHKQNASFSAAIPIVNKVGGLTDGLKDGVNAIFSEFKNKYDNYGDAIAFNRKAFADALDKAYKLYQNKAKFAKVQENSYKADHSWLKPNGAIERYAQTLVDLKVLDPKVLETLS